MLCQGRFKLDMWKNSYTERVVKHCNKLHREVMGYSFPNVFKRYVLMALKDMVR